MLWNFISSGCLSGGLFLIILSRSTITLAYFLLYLECKLFSKIFVLCIWLLSCVTYFLFTKFYNPVWFVCVIVFRYVRAFQIFCPISWFSPSAWNMIIVPMLLCATFCHSQNVINDRFVFCVTKNSHFDYLISSSKLKTAVSALFLLVFMCGQHRKISQKKS